MSSVRTTVVPFRLAAVAVLALATLPLSGCLFSSIPAETPTTEKPTDAPDPTPSADGSDDGDEGAPRPLFRSRTATCSRTPSTSNGVTAS